MPHTFPEEKLLDGDIPDVEVINRLVLPIAAKVGGRINEHDIYAPTPLFAFANLVASCYYRVGFAKAEVDPGLIVGINWFNRGGGGTGPDATFVLQDSVGWQAVDALTKTLSAGEDVFLLIAQVQQAAWLGGGSDADVPDENTATRAQYVLRVDGIPLDETLTGSAFFPNAPPQSLYTVNKDAEDFDWRHIQYVQNSTGINHFAYAPRMMTIYRSSPGSRVFDVAARRLSNNTHTIEAVGAGTDIELFNRKLAIIRIKGLSEHEGSAPVTPNVAAFDDADVISAASLHTNRLNRVRTALNDLGVEHLERGALRHEHLPSVVTYPKHVAITPGSSVPITSVYAGYGAAGGWTVVSDGAGGNLRTGGAAMDLSANAGVLVILANVQIRYLANAVGPVTQRRYLGVLSLRYRNTLATDVLVPGSEVYINNNTTQIARVEIDDDLPLMWVIDTATLSAADKQMSYIEVVGATHDGTGAAAVVTMKTQRGCLFSFLLRGATLA